MPGSNARPVDRAFHLNSRFELIFNSDVMVGSLTNESYLINLKISYNYSTLYLFPSCINK